MRKTSVTLIDLWSSLEVLIHKSQGGGTVSGRLVASIKKQVARKSAGFESDSFGTSKSSSFMGTGCFDKNTESGLRTLGEYIRHQ